jgi:hypothetical protein
VAMRKAVENARGSKRLTRARIRLLLLAVSVSLAACSSPTGTPSTGGAPSSTSASVSGAHLPAGVRVRTVSSPHFASNGLEALSSVVEVTPTGPLAAPAVVRIKMGQAVPTSSALVVRTSESEAGPWSYLPATLSADRRTVVVTTDHFSFFQAFGFDVGQAVDIFRSDFLDQIDQGATMNVSKPQCQGQSGARSGDYSITSSTTDTVYWCFGLDGTQRILMVTDDRRYPLEILHPHLIVSHPGSIDWGQLSSLSHLGSGLYSILAPGDTVTYAVNVPPSSRGGIATTFDGLGQSLDALQVGITTLVDILTRFGVGSGVSSVDALGTALSTVGCADALTQGPGAILASCLSPPELVALFGAKGLLLAPIVAASGLVAFFHSEFNALVDLIKNHNDYTAIITNSSSAPTTTLGSNQFQPALAGFGAPEPSTVAYGLDGYSQATHLTWTTWGQSQATSTGTGWYVPPNDSQAQGMNEPIDMVAFGLGTCGSGSAYTKLSWYFPTEGESFDPSYYLNACTGALVIPAPATSTTTTTTTTQPPASSAPCDVNALAQAATAYESSNGDPDGSGSVIDGYVCDGTYAATSYTPGNDPETGASMAFLWSGGAWQAIGEGNIVPPNIGIPADVYSVLENGLANPRPANVPF